MYVVIAARIYVIRFYAKNVKTELTPDEKKQTRQIAAHLKGAQDYDQEGKCEAKDDDGRRRPDRGNDLNLAHEQGKIELEHV